MRRIALDLDGCVYNYSATACYLLNYYKGYNLDWKDTNSWDWLQQQVKNNDWQWLWSGGVRKGLFRYGHLIKGAREGVEELAKLGRVVVVTARPFNAIQDTMDWLAFMKFPISEVHILGTHAENKAKIVPKFDLAIDDAPKHVETFVTEGIPTIMPLYPYNQTLEGRDLVHAAMGWGEIIQSAKEVLNG